MSTVTLVADGHAAANLILLDARGVTVPVVEEEPDNAVGGADGDVVHVEIDSPNRSAKHLQK